ncbi:MAG: MBL fold metallo-hydrolase, partial [Chthoniobacterales bacterium]|nr:MBL fold metallo-hydrolase [Chthoniobacterales bacterium]
MGTFSITFLGTGTSAGIPVIGCSCRVCTSMDPRDQRLRTALLVQAPDTSFVFDTPPDFRSQCLRAKICKLDAVVYTHSHIDHIAGFDDLRRFCEMENRGMPIYADPFTMDVLRRVFFYAFNYEGPVPKTYVRPEPVLIHAPFQLGQNLLVPVDLPHGKL